MSDDKPADDKLALIVQRKMQGLSAERTTGGVVPGERCRDCNGPVAEKGTQAQAEGLCGDCASWRRRGGHWKNGQLLP
jgi:hypothetical protein